jgi:hypothetical protein
MEAFWREVNKGFVEVVSENVVCRAHASPLFEMLQSRK